jgi:hypothetical protein
VLVQLGAVGAHEVWADRPQEPLWLVLQDLPVSVCADGANGLTRGSLLRARELGIEIPPGAAVVVIVLMVAASVVTGRNAAEAPAGVVEPVACTVPTEPPSRGVESDLPLERLQRAKREGEPMDLFAPPAPPVA